MIDIATSAEAEDCDYLVCVTLGTPSPFSDNQQGTCCACGVAVIFRPHSPVKPPRICLQCAVAMSGPLQ